VIKITFFDGFLSQWKWHKRYSQVEGQEFNPALPTKVLYQVEPLHEHGRKTDPAFTREAERGFYLLLMYLFLAKDRMPTPRETGHEPGVLRNGYGGSNRRTEFRRIRTPQERVRCTDS
jgi:hypothetical protein